MNIQLTVTILREYSGSTVAISVNILGFSVNIQGFSLTFPDCLGHFSEYIQV